MMNLRSDLPGARLPVIAIVLALFLSACAGRPETGALIINTDPAPDAKIHDILIATTRQKDSTPDTYYNGERSEALSFAQAKISVPPTHKGGAIEWPQSPPGNPKTDFVTREAGYIDGEKAFVDQLNQQLRSKPKGQRNVLLFIHGYNTLFAEGLYRLAQFAHDSKSPVVPVLFTWASRGQLSGYVYDLNSAVIARDSLEKTLMLIDRSEADSISILAHSMGNYLLMETGRQLSAETSRRLDRKLETVVMAAPDIDIDVLKATLRHMGRPKKPYIIVVSRDDSALRLSRKVAGDVERVGAYSNDQELAELGAIVIDVTELQTAETSNHSKFAALAEFSPELRAALANSGLTDVASISGPSDLGNDLGEFVGTTAQTAVTLPIKIVTAPFTLIGATGRR